MSRWLIPVVLGLTAVPLSRAEVVVRPAEYRHGNTVLEGVLAWDTAHPGRRGAILIAHGGVGNGSAARARATQYAKMGYVAFAIDLFGKGIAPKDGKDAVAKLGLMGNDRALIRGRAEAALTYLVKQSQVDPKRVAAVGYGIGGTAMLELARTGADLEGVAVFHALLNTPNPADGKKISASVLVVVGTADPALAVPGASLQQFESEMAAGGVDWQVLRLGGVGGDFTNPQAGRDLKTGYAYDADADSRSHALVRHFLTESLAPPPAVAVKPAVPKPAAPRAKGVPEKALKVLEHVDAHREPMANYEGGRTFGNYERRLPQTDAQGRRLRYREWDVNPLVPGRNRGTERLITGSDGSAYYTDDHYNSFKKIR